MPYCRAAVCPCYTFCPVPSSRASVLERNEKTGANPEGRCSREVGLSQNAVVVLVVVFESTSVFALAKSG
jgi:hypothetical protein